MPLPPCIRLLEGEALETAEQTVIGIAPALDRGDGHRGAKLAECTRVVYESGGFDQMFDDHLHGLAAGATALGESKAIVSDDVMTGQSGRSKFGRFGALEVDLVELADFVAAVSWKNEKDQYGDWTIPILDDWPKEAAEIASPDFVDGWTITSTEGTWCWVDLQVMEDCKLTAPATFLAAYKAARPKVAIDPITFLHSDGAELIAENRSEAYTKRAKKYFEPMYGVEGAQRIWEIYEASAAEDKWYRSWDAKEKLFTAAIDADPKLRIDLEALWDGTYVGS